MRHYSIRARDAGDIGGYDEGNSDAPVAGGRGRARARAELVEVIVPLGITVGTADVARRIGMERQR